MPYYPTLAEDLANIEERLLRYERLIAARRAPRTLLEDEIVKRLGWLRGVWASDPGKQRRELALVGHLIARLSEQGPGRP